MLQRLLGLETEYAIGVSPRRGLLDPSNADVYGAILEAVRAQVASHPGEASIQQIFLVNGGSLSYESLPWAREDGLVEGGTAECRSPSTALLYQRAQDALLARALPHAEHRLTGLGWWVRLSLRKNCRDVEGHVYGAQENYEAELARGPALWAWRLGLGLLLPVVLVCSLVTWVGAIVLLVGALGSLVVLGVAAQLFARLRERPFFEALFGRGQSRFIEQLLARPFSMIERVIWEPTIVPFFWLAAALAFGRVRRRALAFLVTRPVLTGTGTLHPDGRFGLSEKGPAIVGISRRGVGPSDRCVWDGGNLYKGVMGLAMLRWRRFAALFRRRQRLQLGLSDSNVTQVAEYLKLGTTALVLDMVEAGALDDLPRLRRPVTALHAIVEDPTLQATVRWGSESLTALQVQRRYWERARDFVKRSPTPALEAAELVELWGRTLDGLERDPASQVGRVDWVTKRFLLDTAGAGESWAVRKTIDLKLHQIGPEGYLAWLEAEGLAPRLVDQAAVDAAIEQPPPDSPAQRRSRLIRALQDQDAEVKVYWDRVRVGGPLRGRVIRLADYRPERPESSESSEEDPS